MTRSDALNGVFFHAGQYTSRVHSMHQRCCHLADDSGVVEVDTDTPSFNIKIINTMQSNCLTEMIY